MLLQHNMMVCQQYHLAMKVPLDEATWTKQAAHQQSARQPSPHRNRVAPAHCNTRMQPHVTALWPRSNDRCAKSAQLRHTQMPSQYTKRHYKITVGTGASPAPMQCWSCVLHAVCASCVVSVLAGGPAGEVITGVVVQQRPRPHRTRQAAVSERPGHTAGRQQRERGREGSVEGQRCVRCTQAASRSHLPRQLEPLCQAEHTGLSILKSD